MSEREAVMTTESELAIGRILRLGSRPFQEGDIQEYERCKKIVMDQVAKITDYAPNWAADRFKGAQGD